MEPKTHLVHPPEWGDIDGLSSDGTGASDTGRVLTGPRVDDGRDKDLQRVFAGQQVHDLEGVLHNSAGHQLLAVVAAVHHQGICESLHNRALCLAEAFCGVPAGGVRQVSCILFLYSNVILQSNTKIIMASPKFFLS
jgi:hypothetical protein